MMKKWLLSTSAIILMTVNLSAQDIHFSQFNRSYLNLNPALTGSFDGDFRFNGNFKNQWSSVSQPYQTFSFSAEARSPFSKIPRLHLGVLFFNDEAGIGGLKTTEFALNTAYSFKLNRDSSLTAKAGIQLGMQARSINFDLFSFDQQYNGTIFDQNLPNGEDFDRSSYASFALHSGISFEYNYARRKSFQAGISFFNITGPNQSFEGSNIPLDLRITTNLAADYIISRKVDILPSLIFSHQGKYNELVLGSEVRYRLNGESFSQRNLYGGLFYRNKDALILSAGFDYQPWHFGVSYDINVSDLDIASRNRGGLELSVTYIFKNFKPNIRRYKVCPEFM